MKNLDYVLTQKKLLTRKFAEKSGILFSRLEQIINKEAEPTMSDLRKLSKALNLSIDFLLSDNKKFHEVNVLFRKGISSVQDQITADKISHFIGNTFTIIEENIPSKFNIIEAEESLDDTELLASQFRNIFCKGDLISPLLNLSEIIYSNLNVIIFVSELGVNVDGASAIIDGVPFIFISPRYKPRMLFTLAHELGHLIMHHRDSQNFAIFDKAISLSSKQDEETFANEFASNLLLPRNGVGIALQKFRRHFNLQGDLSDIELLFLSRVYGVSFQVAGLRCEKLQLLPKGGTQALYEKIKKEFGSPEKRADELSLPPRADINIPQVSPFLIHSAIHKINRGVLSIGKASEILSIPINMILEYNSAYNS